MFELKQIGVVRNDEPRWDSPHPRYLPARLELEPQYEVALDGLAQNSHIWVLCLFERTKRDASLTVQPKQIDPRIPRFGVLSLRAPNHPNPIGLTLAKLVKIEGSTVYVENLDAYDGTPVLDIKPYFDRDIVFSPQMPDIRHRDEPQRLQHLLTVALNQHQELCPGLALAVKMALFVEQHYGLKLLARELTLEVSGDACLADSLQGICRARLANPARFFYRPGGPDGCIWQTPGQAYLVLIEKPAKAFNAQQILEKTPQELFVAIEL